jgi:hypothetical protein
VIITSGPLKEALGMKRYTELCMTGCTANQKNFFPQEFRHFVSAGELVQRGGDYVEKLCRFVSHSLNKLFSKMFSSFSFDCPRKLTVNFKTEHTRTERLRECVGVQYCWLRGISLILRCNKL